MMRRRRAGGNQALALINQALVNIDADNAVTSAGLVTELPNTGTGGSAYDLDVIIDTAANLKIHHSGAALTFGSGAYVSTPDTAANSVTGDIIIRWFGILDDWDVSGDGILAGKDFGTQRSYALWYQGNDTLRFSWTTNGSTFLAAVSTVAASTVLTNGQLSGIEARRDSSTGDVTFRYSTDNGASWTQLGDVRTSTPSGMYDSTTDFTIGAQAGGSLSAKGHHYRVEVYSDLTETTKVVDWSAADQTDSDNGDSSTFTSGGVTWTQHGNCFIQDTGHDMVHTVGNAGFESTAGQAISADTTEIIVARFSEASPSADQYLTDSRSNSGARRAIYSDDSSSDDISIYAGTALSLGGSYTNDLIVIAADYNGDSTSNVEAAGSTQTGSTGAQNLDYGSLFTAYNGVLSFKGGFRQRLLFTPALTTAQRSVVVSYLKSFNGGAL